MAYSANSRQWRVATHALRHGCPANLKSSISLSQDISVAEADGRLLGFMSLAEGGYIDFAYLRGEAVGA